MRATKAVGPKAAALKYDILTALLSLSVHDRGVDGRLAQRLALLITARFSWRTETFAVGIQELARLWSVTDRTAKREMAQMRTRGWITVERTARRGRVAEHRIHVQVLLDATRLYWPAVGPDFVQRMGQGGNVPDNTVVPFPPSGKVPVAPVPDGSVWSAASVLLHEQDAALHTAWFARLVQAGAGQGRLELVAPTRFTASYVQTHLLGRILAAVAMVDPTITKITISGVS